MKYTYQRFRGYVRQGMAQAKNFWQLIVTSDTTWRHSGFHSRYFHLQKTRRRLPEQKTICHWHPWQDFRTRWLHARVQKKQLGHIQRYHSRLLRLQRIFRNQFLPWFQYSCSFTSHSHIPTFWRKNWSWNVRTIHWRRWNLWRITWFIIEVPKLIVLSSFLSNIDLASEITFSINSPGVFTIGWPFFPFMTTSFWNSFWFHSAICAAWSLNISGNTDVIEVSFWMEQASAGIVALPVAPWNLLQPETPETSNQTVCVIHTLSHGHRELSVRTHAGLTIRSKKNSQCLTKNRSFSAFPLASIIFFQATNFQTRNVIANWSAWRVDEKSQAYQKKRTFRRREDRKIVISNLFINACERSEEALQNIN